MHSNHSDTDINVNAADLNPFDRLATTMVTVDEIRGAPGSALRQLRQTLSEIADELADTTD